MRRSGGLSSPTTFRVWLRPAAARTADAPPGVAASLGGVPTTTSGPLSSAPTFHSDRDSHCPDFVPTWPDDQALESRDASVGEVGLFDRGGHAGRRGRHRFAEDRPGIADSEVEQALLVGHVLGVRDEDERAGDEQADDQRGHGQPVQSARPDARRRAGADAVRPPHPREWSPAAAALIRLNSTAASLAGVGVSRDASRSAPQSRIHPLSGEVGESFPARLPQATARDPSRPVPCQRGRRPDCARRRRRARA